MIDLRPIHIDTARQRIDFVGRSRAATAFASDQLEGTVAIHNILARVGFAYLADEVGMGKTYVALGVVALMRHFHPELRVLYIAPRENIQAKWRKEYRNFVANNWRLRDLRVRTLQDTPAVDLHPCRNLYALAHAAVHDVQADFLTRLPSYSIAMPGAEGSDKWRERRDQILRLLPWLPKEAFHLHSRRRFKEAYARAINVALPHIDLLVVDEGHNLKEGFGPQVSDRNRVLGLALGLDDDDMAVFEGGGRRVDRVLVLSATPLESDFSELYRQLQLFGRGHDEHARALADPERSEGDKKAIAQRFMVRRLTGLPIGNERRTKNMYRREWRRGGVRVHAEALEAADERQRLVVGLVQKKVMDVLATVNRQRGRRFGRQFQMGMLASFESFFETAKVKKAGAVESAFDQIEQTEDRTEREGVDARSLDELARSYREQFRASLPHPKMDAVAVSLGEQMTRGEKTLVFVRRVASVPELADKVAHHYDAWLFEHLRAHAGSASLATEIEQICDRYRRLRHRDEQLEHEESAQDQGVAVEGTVPPVADLTDTGGRDSFFSWFFRGAGPKGVLSGASFRKNRLAGESAALSAFFDDNHLAWLLDYPDQPLIALAESLGREIESLGEELRREAYAVYRRRSKNESFPRRRVFRAYQEAALHRLASAAHEQLAHRARLVLDEAYGGLPPATHPGAVPRLFPHADESLAEETLFTHLAQHPSLRDELWPEPPAQDGARGEDFRARFREREQRRAMVAAVIGLGHPFIDLWLLAVRRLGTLDLGAQERRGADVASELARDFLDTLSRQPRDGALSSRRELAELGSSFHLIMDTNFPELRDKPLTELPRYFADTLGRQLPVGGMFGAVNQKLVKQFRMPGYPYVLISTDLLQEGEDLHTFASRVVHYGITWTPSAMEQRVGRIDRIGSLTHRRLANRDAVEDDELLQVQYPYLAETVELAQTCTIFRRMDRFIALLHEGAGVQELGSSAIDFTRAVFDALEVPPPVAGTLESPFVVRDELLRPDGIRPLPAIEDASGPLLSQFNDLLDALAAQVQIGWDTDEGHARWGTTWLHRRQLVTRAAPRTDARRQPFRVCVESGGGVILMRFIAPVGIVDLADSSVLEQVLAHQRQLPTAKLCATTDVLEQNYNLSAEVDVVLHRDTTQIGEVHDALERAASCADALEETLLAIDLVQSFRLPASKGLMNA